MFYVKNPKIRVANTEHIISLVKDHQFSLYAGHHNGDISRIKNKNSVVLHKGLNDRPALVEFNSKYSKIYGASDSNIYDLNKIQDSILILGTRKLAEEI